MNVLQPVNRRETVDDSTQSSENDGRGQNPASQANLKPFEKGHSGNPSGRQKKNIEFVNALKAYGKLESDRTVNAWAEDGRNNSESVVKRVWVNAIGGDYKAIRLMLDYEVLEDGLLDLKTE